MRLEDRETLQELFEKYKDVLTQTQRQAMHLNLIEDLSFKEISAILAVTRQAAHDAFKKGEKKLLDLFKKIG